MGRQSGDDGVADRHALHAAGGGGILFIEDVNEHPHPYRVERMIYQLHQSGILARQQALGEFTGGKLSEYDNGYTFETMLEQFSSVIRIPVVTGLQFGHVSERALFLRAPSMGAILEV